MLEPRVRRLHEPPHAADAPREVLVLAEPVADEPLVEAEAPEDLTAVRHVAADERRRELHGARPRVVRDEPGALDAARPAERIHQEEAAERGREQIGRAWWRQRVQRA